MRRIWTGWAWRLPGSPTTARGLPSSDGLRSSNRQVYAVGDAAGGLQFTHVAGYHAGVVIRSILFGLPAKARTDHIPWVTYTDPELAQVGLTEAAGARGARQQADVVRFAYDENDRAIAERPHHRSDQGDGGRAVGRSARRSSAHRRAS